MDKAAKFKTLRGNSKYLKHYWSKSRWIPLYASWWEIPFSQQFQNLGILIDDCGFLDCWCDMRRTSLRDDFQLKSLPVLWASIYRSHLQFSIDNSGAFPFEFQDPSLHVFGLVHNAQHPSWCTLLVIHTFGKNHWDHSMQHLKSKHRTFLTDRSSDFKILIYITILNWKLLHLRPVQVLFL